ncbi:hypothetical protein ERJ75_001424600 [Trypanosoma vivax]|nr:hypothetical protein ERJ75_001424600 [Trypanosoma vivax]
MPSRPGFLLQDAWDEMAVWARAVVEMGLMEGPNRLGRCVYNRRRLLLAPGACPGAQVESLVGALKGAYRQARPKGQKTTNACGESNEMLQLRANGALQPCALCEDGSWALLESKKRTAVPKTMNSGADMVLDSPAEENR